jgi:serine/threonine protein kinase
MSPEHRRSGDPSPDCDLWVMAIMAVEMTAGVRPSAVSVESGPMDPRAAAGLSALVRAFAARALSLNPIERPESARNRLTAFETALEADRVVRS